MQDNESVSLQETTGEGGDEGWTYRRRGGGKALPGALTQADLMISVDYTSFFQLQFTNFTSVLKPLRCIYILLGILGAFSWQFLVFTAHLLFFVHHPEFPAAAAAAVFSKQALIKPTICHLARVLPSRFCITAVHEIVTVNLKLFSWVPDTPSFISLPSPGITILLNSQFLPVYDIVTSFFLVICSLLRSGGENRFQTGIVL